MSRLRMLSAMLLLLSLFASPASAQTGSTTDVIAEQYRAAHDDIRLESSFLTPGTPILEGPEQYLANPFDLLARRCSGMYDAFLGYDKPAAAAEIRMAATVFVRNSSQCPEVVVGVRLGNTANTVTSKIRYPIRPITQNTEWSTPVVETFTGSPSDTQTSTFRSAPIVTSDQDSVTMRGLGSELYWQYAVALRDGDTVTTLGCQTWRAFVGGDPEPAPDIGCGTLLRAIENG